MSDIETTKAPPVFDFDPATASGAVIRALYALQDAEALNRHRTRDSLGIGSNELNAIQFLRRLENLHRDARPRDVALTLGVTSAAATILVTRLVTSGFVTRHADPQDGRGQLLRLTDVARAKMSAAVGLSQTDLHQLLSAMTKRESRRIVVLLSAVTDSLDAGATAAAH